MPRELKQTDRNKITIDDGVTGETVTLFYRMPTTSERIAFESRSYHREGDTLIDESPAAKVEGALRIITGWDPPGYFTFDGEPISWDPADPRYREDWKELLDETAGDILQALGAVVFQGTVPSGGKRELKIERRAGSVIPPSQRNSNG